MTHRIGKFELRNVLGEGASSTVYLALDTFSGQDVALKVLKPDAVPDPELERTRTTQFLSEASLAGKLSHPHIASILEAAVDENSGYIAMEYVPGGDLSQYTAAGNLLSVEAAIEIAFKCCSALNYAFRQGIVHRDIKPANIMVVSGTNIKVTDFGAAYLLHAKETHALDIGSPLYMSPEQVLNQPLDHHSDMFALGVVLYELFTGQRPFVADTLDGVFAKILREDPVPPSRLRSEIAPEVEKVLLRMLQKDPAARYPTWADLALDLADIGRLSSYKRGIPDIEKFTALRKIALLERLNDAELWELVHAGRWTRIPAHTTIVREGEPGQSLFFIGEGQVKVTKQGRLLNVLAAGEYVGEMAYIKAGAMPRSATVESLSDVLIAEFKPASLRRTSTNCQLQVTLALTDLLVDRLALADERIARGTA
jgi:serine/threonine protein kinase